MGISIDNSSNSKLLLETLIQASKLSTEEQQLWEEVLQTDQELNLMPLVELIREDQKNLHILTKNLQEKTALLKAGDETAFIEMIDQEMNV